MNRDSLVASGVAGAAFFASAAHIVEVVSETNHVAFALVYPLAIDGMIYIGIRALQSGRKFAGFSAIFTGAAYSLLFNAHAENAITMNPLLIAASMPIALLVSFIVVHTGHKTEEKAEVKEVEKIVEIEKIVTVAPKLLPIVPAAPKPTVVPTMNRRGGTTFVKADAPEPAPVRTSTAGRKAKWDVEEAVRLLTDGRTDAEVMDASGVTDKPLQRTKRVIRLLSDTTDSAEMIAKTCQVSVSHVLRVRAALVKVTA